MLDSHSLRSVTMPAFTWGKIPGLGVAARLVRAERGKRHKKTRDDES